MVETQNEIWSAYDFLQQISVEDKPVLIKFTKKDGSDRIMKCTLNFSKIPKEFRPKGGVNLKDILTQIKKNKVLRVFDVEKLGWRSVAFDRTEWLKTDDKTYSIRKVEEIFKK